ncbi:MAG: tetratricopeptide repeat protein [Sphingomonadales bacterium]|jgi:tetratricopeptide (TPR) repeat protein
MKQYFLLSLVFSLVFCHQANAEELGSNLSIGNSALVKEGDSALTNGDSARAIKIYKRALERNVPRRQRYQLYNNYCAALNEQSLHGEAINMCRKAIAINSRRWQAYNNLGMAYHGLTLYSQAIKSFNKALLHSQNKRLILKNKAISLAAEKHWADYYNIMG